MWLIVEWEDNYARRYTERREWETRGQDTKYHIPTLIVTNVVRSGDSIWLAYKLPSCRFRVDRCGKLSRRTFCHAYPNYGGTQPIRRQTGIQSVYEF